MKYFYTDGDCKKLHELINHGIRDFVFKNDLSNTFLLLSGGIDSVTCLYSLIEQNIDFTAINFHFDGYASSDLLHVRALQNKIGFKCIYYKIPSSPSEIYADINEAVKLCYAIYGRIRKVKCETIFALNYLKRIIPVGSNIISAACGDDVIGYNKKNCNDLYKIW